MSLTDEKINALEHKKNLAGLIVANLFPVTLSTNLHLLKKNYIASALKC